MPRELALLTSAAIDGEAQAASKERRPEGPERTSGDGAWALPESANLSEAKCEPYYARTMPCWMSRR